MKKITMCAALGLSVMLAACGPKQTEEIATQPEETQAVVDTSWREGKDYLGYDVNDKNGARKLWVDFGAESAGVYEDNGTQIATLNYGQLSDLEYAKAGFKFEDTDNDGYVDISMPYVKDVFGNYTYHWIYNFVSREFMDKYSELTNEKEVLWLIANGILGQNSSRQITQVFNSTDIGVVNGNITLDGHVCKAYNIVDNGNVSARLYFDQDGEWYIDDGCRQIYSIIDSNDESYFFNGVCATERARAIAGYTLGDYYANPSGVSAAIIELWVAAGENVSSISAGSIQNAVEGVVNAYEIVIDDEGTIRRMSRATNVFDMACRQLGIDSGRYSNIR